MSIEWAAGLFEGEGAASSDGKDPRLQIKMVEEESVRRFAQVIGVGKVYGPYGPYPSQMGKRPIFMWVAERSDYWTACDLLRPHVSPWLAAKLPERS